MSYPVCRQVLFSLEKIAGTLIHETIRLLFHLLHTVEKILKMKPVNISQVALIRALPEGVGVGPVVFTLLTFANGR